MVAPVRGIAGFHVSENPINNLSEAREVCVRVARILKEQEIFTGTQRDFTTGERVQVRGMQVVALTGDDKACEDYGWILSYFLVAGWSVSYYNRQCDIRTEEGEVVPHFLALRSTERDCSPEVLEEKVNKLFTRMVDGWLPVDPIESELDKTIKVHEGFRYFMKPQDPAEKLEHLGSIFDRVAAFFGMKGGLTVQKSWTDGEGGMSEFYWLGIRNDLLDLAKEKLGLTFL